MKKTAARLGQHFLTNDYYAKVLADAVQVRPGETIVEVGPGKGALTKHLLTTGAPVVAIEKDEVLAAGLADLFQDSKLRVIPGDIRAVFGGEKTASDARRRDSMRVGIASRTRNHTERTVTSTSGTRYDADGVVLSSPYVVAANIPYYITGEIIRSFLEAESQPRAMALLIQKEVAERIIARDGKESILSLSVKVFGMPRIVAKVAKGNFNPPPQVDSAIILIDDISRRHFDNHADERAFFAAVRAGFSSKRKILAGNLAKQYGKEAVARAYASCGIAERARAEDLPLATWLSLAHSLNAPVSERS